MAPDAFSEQRRHGPPLALDPTHTALIVVDMVNEFFEPGGTACISALGEPDVNIFVGNLAFTTTEQTLRDLFASYGTVDTVRIMTDRETGRPRGFGFVEMPDGTAARAAIAGLQGHELDGRALTVNEARPREERGRPREDRREPRRPRW